MHRIIVVGRLGKDVTIHKETVASFSVASDEFGGAMWFNCVAFKASMGEKLFGFVQKLKKGDGVFVDGNLKDREYENKDGQKIKAQDLIIGSISYASMGKKADGAPKAEGAASTPKSEAPKGKPEDDDSNIPF